VTTPAPETPQADTPSKPPWLEREFLLALVAMFLGIILVIVGQSEAGSVIISSAVGGYAVSRGIAKRK